MANPFATMLGVSPNTAGAPAPGGSGAGIAAPAPQNVPPAPVPGGGSGGSNPFSGVMTSDAPGIFGLLGRMAGNPTSTEMMYRRMGQQQGEGLQGLSERLQKGMPQQQAILDWMNNDPRAMEVFRSSADPVGTIRGMLGTLAPPGHFGTVGGSTYDQYTGKIVDTAPTNVGPGDMRVNGQGQVIAQNLPADVQSAKAFQQAAGMSDNDAQQLYQGMLKVKATSDVSVKNDALNQLVQSNVITPDMANKIKSGVVQVNPFYDASGHQLGLTYTDLTDMLATNDPNKIHSTVVGINNNTPIRNLPGGAKTDEYGVPLGIHPSPDIILGAGPIGQLADHLSAYTSIVDPKHLSAPFYNDAHDQMESIVGMLGDLVQAGNGKFKGPYEQFKDMVEEHGYTGSPMQQGIAFRNLIRMAQREIKVNNAQIADMSGTVTGATKDEASQFNGKLRNILAALPDADANEAMIDKITNQGAGGLAEAATHVRNNIGEAIQGTKENLTNAAKAVQGAANSATDAATGAPTSSGANPPPSFKTEQDAIAAAKAGQLTPGGDGTIPYLLNGVPMILRPKAAKK